MSITTTHKLLTAGWRADVHALETAIGRLSLTGLRGNDCRISFFEMAGDPELHVNVTHKYQTTSVSGWAGPASMVEGFVHNRTFGDMQPSVMIRHIREMVFARRHHGAHANG